MSQPHLLGAYWWAELAKKSGSSCFRLAGRWGPLWGGEAMLQLLQVCLWAEHPHHHGRNCFGVVRVLAGVSTSCDSDSSHSVGRKAGHCSDQAWLPCVKGRGCFRWRGACWYRPVGWVISTGEWLGSVSGANKVDRMFQDWISPASGKLGQRRTIKMVPARISFPGESSCRSLPFWHRP